MKRLLLLGSTVLLAACADSVTAPSKNVAPAGQPSFAVTSDGGLSSTKNWRIYNIMPSTSSLWDINKVQTDDLGGLLQFPIQQFLTTGTGSFAVYLFNNYNIDMTGKTISATDMSWTSGTYVTRGAASDGAYVRLVFKDVASGPFTSSDYWWSTGSLDLNTLTSGNLAGDLADRTQWTNICGQHADDTTIYPAQSNCVGGTDPAGSPYDGFTNAVKNVKQVGLSFGRAGSYASGVARVGGIGTFHLASFTIAAP